MYAWHCTKFSSRELIQVLIQCFASCWLAGFTSWLQMCKLYCVCSSAQSCSELHFQFKQSFQVESLKLIQCCHYSKNNDKTLINIIKMRITCQYQDKYRNNILVHSKYSTEKGLVDSQLMLISKERVKLFFEKCRPSLMKRECLRV